MGISYDTLHRMNAEGRGPNPYRLREDAGRGSPAKYRLEDIDAFMSTNGRVRRAADLQNLPTAKRGRPPSHLKR